MTAQDRSLEYYQSYHLLITMLDFWRSISGRCPKDWAYTDQTREEKLPKELEELKYYCLFQGCDGCKFRENNRCKMFSLELEKCSAYDIKKYIKTIKED